MGKRNRKRAGEPAERARPSWQTARVRVDDATWAEYRRSLGEGSVSEALGRHVELEVARWRRDRAAGWRELQEREVVELLERIEAAQVTLDAMTQRLAIRRPAPPSG